MEREEVYNPAVAYRQRKLAQEEQTAIGDDSVRDANVIASCSSALDVADTNTCPKCGNACVPSQLRHGVPAMFCQQCAVAMPVIGVE